MIVSHVAIVGLGLIGGSLARALRACGAVAHISGYDPDSSQRETAQRLGIIDQVCTTPADAVRGADVVVLAVPVLRTAEALAGCLPARRADAVVTDVGSTKQSVLDDVARICGSVPAWFVAAHPIAGTEKSGIAHAQAELFHRRRVILTPHEGQDPAARSLVMRLWQAAGARVVEMDARRHDAIFAATSHLPHVLAYGFVDMLAGLDRDHDIFPNAGGGFRDFTRIASSSPQMWHDIIRANADAVGDLLDRQIDALLQIRAMMREGRWDALKALFQRARDARERYLAQIE
ncbi:prephenate dehydrogenase [Fontimonas thermophila]|uniref:Prephenate dehydrogenase n=1 Tax=Fontimonas thermophila TaxID=1076937 RepID=A0A1I2HNG4_9GAMM|nr:prephenate dehydrogenase/arogenate dehydrogenase family protein [Fontimonas thermophila]SFF30963.1 prephenate dehydrogenase [Fontimonas thermophila]